MGALTEWVTNIILFILLATIIDLLLPSSSMQKYAKMVIGLLLMLIILTPVFSIFKVNVDKLFTAINSSSISQENSSKNLLDLKKKEIQASQDAYILEQMAVQLEEGVKEELVKEYGVEVSGVEVHMKDEKGEKSFENISSISLSVQPKENKHTASVSEVEVVSINTSEPIKKEKTENDEKLKKVQSFLSKKWDMNKKQIIVTMGGGEADER
ncbi:stage III sporulation protein AF [Priestia endophytica]|jgi:stage III sporulation protein AF|uniref:Stage III sporulation protein AF n=2 Tax=Priestia endophytica TaxID=135735 RepID=A0AAX1QCJ0_9BACI|nr:stage III sporulation protein AF [Priestia endophytica]KYG36028.1 stage III sporulation protein AF [Priestia endophytica]MBG9814971.1 stage III sporulation protein AF [Priestia endophytica]MCM3539559.1 stage III sporulation protein AF [Priestia endophytica]RAS79238.1 stage III sporulation protein AF [Priestia endophytica]RAS81827.1 stage III sporulation protein AF [Priestia endophytica]